MADQSSSESAPAIVPPPSNPIPHNPVPVIALDTTLVTLTPYTGEYFSIWKFQIQCIFRSRQLLDIVEGRENFDPTASVLIQQSWRQRDQQAMDILIQTMNRKYLPPLFQANVDPTSPPL
jgi:hypothetical protein